MTQIFIRRIIFLCSLFLGAAIATEAQANNQPGEDGTLQLLIGVFNPTCNSKYWDDSFEVFTGGASDFDDLEIWVDDFWPLSENASLMFSLGWYEGATTQAYQDQLGPAGHEINHKTALRLLEGTLGLAWHFGDRKAPFRPYVAAGAGYLRWKLSERGQFIDFSDPANTIIDANYSSSSGTFSLFGLVGADIRVHDTWSIVIQGRWRQAGDELRGSLTGFGEIDLSGYSYSAGVAFHF